MRLDASQSEKNSINKKRSLLVDILVILFGIGTWIGTNSVFVQLPLLVLKAPEGWNLASYIVIIIQTANIGPILYGFIQRSKLMNDSNVIHGLLCLNVIAALTMSMSYDHTTSIFGAERSFALLAMVFCLSLVGCTSSVLFMPYMGLFKEAYLISYLIGEGLSGLIPSCLALIQGVGGNTECIDNQPYTPPPRFESQSFFLLIFFIFIVSLTSFFLLNKLPSCRKELTTINRETFLTSESENNCNLKVISQNCSRILLLLLGLICLFYIGFLPAIMIYSALPYGNPTYHFVVILNSIANPTACFMAFFFTHNSIKSVVKMVIAVVPLVTYALITSVLSHNPPLVENFIGSAIVVIVWSLIGGLFSYIRLTITSIFREQGGNALIWVGAWTQIGAFIGAILSFSLVNFTNIFVPYKNCP